MSGELISALIGSVVAGAAGVVVIWYAAAALSGRLPSVPKLRGPFRGALGASSGGRAAASGSRTSGAGSSGATESVNDRSGEAWQAMYAASAPFTLTAGIGLLIAALVAPFLGSPMAAGNVILGGVAWLLFWTVSGLARGNRAAKDARPIRR